MPVEFLDEKKTSSKIEFLDEIFKSSKIEFLDEISTSSKIEFLDEETILKPSEEKPKITEGLFGARLGETSPLLALLRKPAQLSRSGLKMITDVISEPERASVLSNILLNIPKTTAEIGSEFSASILDPETFAVGLFGKAIRPALKPISKGIGIVGEEFQRRFPKSAQIFKEKFTVERGLPKDVFEMVESQKLETKKAKLHAQEIANELTEGLLPSERLRIGQILKGGISESPKQIHLKRKALAIREEFDRLKQASKQERLLNDEAYFERLSRRRVNELQLGKEKLKSQIDSVLGLPTKQKIQILVSKVGIKGKEQVEKQTEILRNSILNSPDLTTDDLLNIGKKVVSGFDLMETKISKLLDVSTDKRFQLRKLVQGLSGSNNKEKARILNEIIDLSDESKALGFLEKTRLLQRLSLLDDFVENVSVGGKNQLEKFVQQFRFRFKGQAGFINEVKEKISDIDDRLWINRLYGGTPYTPRLFLPKELERMEQRGIFGFKGFKIKGEAFRKRTFLTPEEEKALGIIEEPAFPFAKRFYDISKDVETAKVFNRVSVNPEWSSNLVKTGFVKIGDDKRKYGSLAGKYVRGDIAKEINEITAIPTEFGRFKKALVGTFKLGKTVLDPAIHSVNAVGNMILLDFSGVDLLKQPQLLSRAVKEIRNKTSLFKKLREMGTVGVEFVETELDDLLLGLNKTGGSSWENIFSSIRKLADKPAKFYSKTEQLFKVAKVLDGLDKGIPLSAAGKEAEKWLFNYDKVSKAIRATRESLVGVPFITFWSKAIPRVAETAIKNPMKLYKYKLLLDAVENEAIEKFKLTDSDVERIHKNTQGLGIILPFKDSQENIQTLNIGRMFFPTAIFQGEPRMFGVIPPSITPLGVTKPLIEIAFNTISYKKELGYKNVKIFEENDKPSTKVRKSIDYLYRAWFPAFSPPVPFVSKGGSSFQKLVSSVEVQKQLEKIPLAEEVLPDFGKVGDALGRVRSVSNVMFDVLLGLRASPTDPALLKRLEEFGIKQDWIDIKKQAFKIMAHKGLTKNEREKQLGIIKEKFADLMLKKSEIEE